MIVFISKNSIRIINPKDQYFVKFFILIFLENENIKEINLNEFNYLEKIKICVDIVCIRALIIKNLKISSKLYWKYKAMILN